MILACGLGLLAGATDAYGLTILHDLYVSFMSGNTTMLGIATGSGDWLRVARIAALIGLFLAGTACGAMTSDAAGPCRAAAVIAVASTALFCAACGPSWAPQTLVFGMGALNAALGQLGGEGIGLTYVTGALVKFGQGFGHWLTGTRTDLAWLVQAVMWASILLGACLATMAMRLGSSGLWPLPLLGFLLSGFATVVERFDDGNMASRTVG